MGRCCLEQKKANREVEGWVKVFDVTERRKRERVSRDWTFRRPDQLILSRKIPTNLRGTREDHTYSMHELTIWGSASGYPPATKIPGPTPTLVCANYVPHQASPAGCSCSLPGILLS